MIESYSSARNLFEAVRDAATERTRTLRQIERLEARRFGAGSSIAGGVRYGRGDVNGMGPTISLIDYQERMRQRIQDDERLMEFAASVVYGIDGVGGVDALMGSTHADALFWRFLAAETWKTCAEQCGTSESTVRRMVWAAFDIVDALGFDNVAKGLGIAED